MLKEQELLKKFYDYLNNLHNSYAKAFKVTSNELIDIRLAILVIKGYSKSYYESSDVEIYNEFHEETKKYVEAINNIHSQCTLLKKQLSIIKEKRYELENSRSYSTKQDDLLNIMANIQQDFENIYPLMENDILEVQNKLKEKVLEYGVNPTDDFSIKEMENVYEQILTNVNRGINLAKNSNKKIKIIKEKIVNIAKDDAFKEKSKNKTSDMMVVEKEEVFRSSKVDSRIFIRFNKNKTKAYFKLNIGKKDRKPVLEKDLRLVLEEAKVVFGIIEDSITYICSTLSRSNVLVAKGISPTAGADAKLEYKFDILHKGKIEESDEDDTIDFKNINAYKSVKVGDTIAEKIPAQKGKDGKTVQGKIIFGKEGLDKEFNLSKNVELSEDGTKVIAKIDGLPIVSAKRQIDIQKTLIIPSDVDYSTGNIEFGGDVIIAGDVLSDFEVKAGGDLIIKGNVYQARIESENGNIRIYAGVSGDGNALVKAKGSIKTKFIEGAKVYCGNDLVVITDILHSRVYVGDNLICRKGKGLISGGYICARNIIECNILGSVSHTPTVVDLGVNLRLREKQYEVLMELTKMKTYITKARNIIERLKQKYENAKKESENIISQKKYHRRYISIKRAHNEKINEFNELKKELEKIEEEKYSSIADAQLIIRQTAYPKVEINAGKRKYTIKVEYIYPVLFRYNSEEGEITSRKIGKDEGFFEEEISSNEKELKKIQKEEKKDQKKTQNG